MACQRRTWTERGSMPVVLTLDKVLRKRGMTQLELAKRVGLSTVAINNMKCGRIRGIRFSSLGAICEVLDCKPGDILDYIPDDDEDSEV